MNLIKLEKKTGDKIEQITLIINLYLLLKGLKLSEPQITALSYFCHYGINLNTENLLYKCKIIGSKLTYHNMLCKFKKLGFIEKTTRNIYIISDEILNSIDDKIAMLIKIDNT